MVVLRTYNLLCTTTPRELLVCHLTSGDIIGNSVLVTLPDRHCAALRDGHE